MGSDFVDEIDCSSFFDHMEDLIEFSPENVCGGVDAVDCNDFPSIWNDPLPDSDPFFLRQLQQFSFRLLRGALSSARGYRSTRVAFNVRGGFLLLWGFDTRKRTLFCQKESSDSKFLTSSPVSVLESSSSSSSSSTSSSGPGKTLPPLSPCPVVHNVLGLNVLVLQLLIPGQ